MTWNVFLCSCYRGDWPRTLALTLTLTLTHASSHVGQTEMGILQYRVFVTRLYLVLLSYFLYCLILAQWANEWPFSLPADPISEGWNHTGIFCKTLLAINYWVLGSVTSSWPQLGAAILATGGAGLGAGLECCPWHCQEQHEKGGIFLCYIIFTKNLLQVKFYFYLQSFSKIREIYPTLPQWLNWNDIYMVLVQQ